MEHAIICVQRWIDSYGVLGTILIIDVHIYVLAHQSSTIGQEMRLVGI